MAEESNRAIVAAFVGNLLITVSKFVAAALSGSSAMLAEAIHSLVDTGNGALLLYGARASRRPPDVDHPFGHGHELYFWTLLVGMIVFGLGGGMSIVTGVSHVLNPIAPGSTTLSYAVIAVAAVFEGGSWYFGVKAFAKERRGRGIVETIRRTKDPTTFAVVLEDSAALVGLALAFAGIFLSAHLDAPWIDGAASVLIGVLLCLVASVMVYESKGLLVGEGVERKTLERLRAIVQADSDVIELKKLLTIYLAPNEILLAIEVRFRSEMTVAELRLAIARVRDAIQAQYPRIRRFFIDATAIGD
jgi:cation diffusion facilitator family transporter